MRGDPRVMRSHLMLLCTASIWGTAFVFQELAIAAGLGVFGFNAMRFGLGAVLLTPLLLVIRLRVRRGVIGQPVPTQVEHSQRGLMIGGVLMGLALAAGSAFQQGGLVDPDTTAGKGGFITGLYVVLVPVMGLALGKRTDLWAWVGVGLAVAGLFLLSIKLDQDRLSIGRGDLLVLIGTGFWATHILLIDHLSKRFDALKLSVIQFYVCAIVSAAIALSIGEANTLGAVTKGWYAIAYCGALAVAVAFTVQVFAQKHAHPTAAAVIMSCEVLFAAVAGALLLGERMTGRAYLGCGLMLLGMLVSQFSPKQPAVAVTPESA